MHSKIALSNTDVKKGNSEKSIIMHARDGNFNDANDFLFL